MWLDTSIWMSAVPLVHGNKSILFRKNKSTGFCHCLGFCSYTGTNQPLPFFLIILHMSVLGIWYAMFIDWIFRILIFAIHYRRHYT